MRLARGIIPSLSLSLACSVTIGEEGVSNVPGEEVWRTEVDLVVGETAFVDGEGLEVTLREVSSDAVTLWIVSEHTAGERVLGVWPEGGEANVRPYRVRLIRGGDTEATIEVRRRWGEWEP